MPSALAGNTFVPYKSGMPENYTSEASQLPANCEYALQML